MPDEEKYRGSLNLGGYGSAENDETEIKRLREITAGREKAESPRPKGHRNAFFLLALLLVALGLVWTTSAFILPTETISDLMIQVDEAVSNFSSSSQTPVIVPAAAEEVAKPDPKASKRRVHNGGAASSNFPAAGSSAHAEGENEQELLAATPPPPVGPFNVEVVDADRRVQPRYTDRTVNLNVQGGGQPRVRADSGGLERLATRPPTVLAREGNVQGSVVLRAVIDRQGYIRELAVVRGPGDLTAAAIEAARHWRFKPFLQDGRPVETETLITVDFNISTQ